MMVAVNTIDLVWPELMTPTPITTSAYVPTHHLTAGHSDTVYCLRFSPDGKFLASGGDDCALIIWSVAEGRVLFRILFRSPVSAILWHPMYAESLIVGCDDGRVLSLHEFSLSHSVQRDIQIGVRSEVHSMAYDSTTRYLALSLGNEVHLTREEARDEYTMTVKLPSPGPDDEIAGERQADQRLRAMGVHFRAKGKELIVSYLAHGIFGSSVISPMGNNLAVYNFVSGVDVYNVGAGEKSLLKSYKLSKPPQSLHKVQVAYAMNGQRLVCGTTTGDVCVWLVENTQFYQLLNHTDHIVMAVDFCQTMGRDNYLYIATGSAGQGQGTYIMLWRAVTSEALILIVRIDAKPGTLYEITTPVGELVESVNNLKAEMRYHFLRLAVAMKAYVLAAFQVIKWLVVVLVTTWSISFVPWGTVTPVILAMCAHLTKLLAMLLPPSFSYAAEAGIDWLKAMVRDWVGVNPVNAVNAVNSATWSRLRIRFAGGRWTVPWLATEIYGDEVDPSYSDVSSNGRIVSDDRYNKTKVSHRHHRCRMRCQTCLSDMFVQRMTFVRIHKVSAQTVERENWTWDGEITRGGELVGESAHPGAQIRPSQPAWLALR
ncbi:WD40 repeat-like protein [Trametes coccinea BRFM310]|uniref:WD40 repeat-like protein n=1 Tax=Trametes coccinea (strain BRFM310) TaxID=1353009 RepID=A0A1Y2IHQ9_TRAC3|nr:WD40 repeat-like protein [Trametes coccinea BRFM310]